MVMVMITGAPTKKRNQQILVFRFGANIWLESYNVNVETSKVKAADQFQKQNEKNQW